MAPLTPYGIINGAPVTNPDGKPSFNFAGIPFAVENNKWGDPNRIKIRTPIGKDIFYTTGPNTSPKYSFDVAGADKTSTFTLNTPAAVDTEYSTFQGGLGKTLFKLTDDAVGRRTNFKAGLGENFFEIEKPRDSITNVYGNQPNDPKTQTSVLNLGKGWKHTEKPFPGTAKVEGAKYYFNPTAANGSAPPYVNAIGDFNQINLADEKK